MRFLDWLKRAIGINTPGWTEYFAFGGGSVTGSGMIVNENNALTISTIHQCVRVIADTIASLPCFVYVRTATGKERAENHPLYRVLHEQTNAYMSPFEFKQTMQGHLCLWGNAFAEIERDGMGRIVGLWPLRPDLMRLQVYNDTVYYYYTLPNGTGEQQIAAANMFHLRGLSADGLIGYSPITLARETLGLHQATEQYRSRFFANDARPGGVLSHPGVLGEEAFQQLKRRWDESHGGTMNRSRVAILEEGMKWQDVGIPPKDAEFIAGQEYQKQDIAGLWRIPPYKIGLMKPGTMSYASVEQQQQDFKDSCIQPWLTCWEERITGSLLTPAERNQYYAEFLVDALLRADADSRAKFYMALFNMGAISANEIRARENLNSIGADGDRYFVPLNMTPVDRVDDLIDVKAEPPQPPMLPAPQPKLNGAAH